MELFEPVGTLTPFHMMPSQLPVNTSYPSLTTASGKLSTATPAAVSCTSTHLQRTTSSEKPQSNLSSVSSKTLSSLSSASALDKHLEPLTHFQSKVSKTGSARVLNSTECLAMIEEKRQKKQVELEEKEKRKEEREKKKKEREEMLKKKKEEREEMFKKKEEKEKLFQKKKEEMLQRKRKEREKQKKCKAGPAANRSKKDVCAVTRSTAGGPSTSVTPQPTEKEMCTVARATAGGPSTSVTPQPTEKEMCTVTRATAGGPSTSVTPQPTEKEMCTVTRATAGGPSTSASIAMMVRSESKCACLRFLIKLRFAIVERAN